MSEYDGPPRRPTFEEIRASAQRHVAYEWTSSPGTHNRNIVWTDEDTAIYMQEYRNALAKRKGTK